MPTTIHQFWFFQEKKQEIQEFTFESFIKYINKNTAIPEALAKLNLDNENVKKINCSNSKG